MRVQQSRTEVLPLTWEIPASRGPGGVSVYLIRRGPLPYVTVTSRRGGGDNRRPAT